MKNLRTRIILILSVAGISAWLFLPLSEEIKLGLDLRGGIHMVVQVRADNALDAELDSVRDNVETLVQEIENSTGKVVRQGLTVVLSDVSNQSEVEDILDPYTPAYNYSKTVRDGRAGYTMRMSASYDRQIRRETVTQARQIIERRVDQYGVAEPSISVYGGGDSVVEDQIIIELPGVDDPSRVRSLIQDTGRLDIKLVHPEQDKAGPFPSEEAAAEAFGGFIPDEYEILGRRVEPVPGQGVDTARSNEIGSFYVVRKAAVISGSHIKTARRGEEQYTGEPNVNFSLNSEGADLFADATERHRGEYLAVVLDKIIYSVAQIEDRIRESGVIRGGFSLEEASDLSLVLRSGAMPAEIDILEDRTVGPSLGLDSIRKGVRASLAGLILVVITMLIIYRFSGLNAVTCLVLNLMILLAALAYIPATLTLPGIAGVILTIGMAVDANILIFERIKEELRFGKTVRVAVQAGFDRVFSTIIDTNVTTLVASLFLYQFGTGPVRGFAITLGVGLLANMFTAVFVSRTFFGLLLQGREVKALSI